MCEINTLLILGCLILCSVIDIRTRKIPTILLIYMSIGAAVCSIWSVHQKIVSALDVAGGIIVGILFLMISKYTEEAVGYGDSWILLLIGACLGCRETLELVMAAFFLTGLVSLIGFTFKKWKKTIAIPFVPFLTAAYIGVVFL